MKTTRIFDSNIKAAKLELLNAKTAKTFYKLLRSLDVKEDAAYRYATTINFSDIIRNKEFSEDDILKVREVMNRYEKAKCM